MGDLPSTSSSKERGRDSDQTALIGTRRTNFNRILGALALGAAVTAGGVLLSQDNKDKGRTYYEWALGKNKKGGQEGQVNRESNHSIQKKESFNETGPSPATEYNPEESSKVALNILNVSIQTRLPRDLQPIADMWIKNIPATKLPQTPGMAFDMVENEFPILIDIGKLNEDKRATAFELIKNGEFPSGVWKKIEG